MDTKEQLELAAKACGYAIDSHQDDGGAIVGDDKNYFYWNPSTDDGDSDRMGTKLRMEAKWFNSGVFVTSYGFTPPLPYYTELFTDHNGDENAALRAARMRCAAEIGKGMA